MKTRLMTHLTLIRNIFLILLFPLLMQAQSSKVIAYYQAYGYGNGQDPWQIDFRNMTHIIHIDGGATDYNPNTSPYWNVKVNVSDSAHLFWFNGNNMVDSLVNRAHTAGVKVLICLGAGGSSTSFESDSAKNEAMANAVVDFAKRHNYDGVDVDWETDNQTQAFNERLLRMLRRRMDNTWGGYRTRGLICWTPAFDFNTARDGQQIRSMWADLIDWLQPQAYDLNTPWTGTNCEYSFDQAVYPPNSTTWPRLHDWQQSWDGQRIGVTGDNSAWAGPAYLATVGWPKSKLVYGFKSYGYGQTGQTNFQYTTNCGDRGAEANIDFMQLALTRGGTRRFDDSSKGLYISGTASSAINAYGFTVGNGQTFIASIEDSISVKEKTKFVKNNGYGGMMYYDIFWGYDDPAVGGSYIAGQAQPLLYIVNRELNGTAVISPIITVTPTSRSFGNVTINTTSSEQTYTVSGSNLTPSSGNIAVTAPTGFQVSKSSGTGFASSVTCAYTNGALGSTIINVRFIPMVVQSYSGSIANSGGAATAENILVSGNGLSDLPSPTGTFIASSDTLPTGGGSVTLTWTSSNAASAFIDNGIGTVATNGSITRTVSATTQFTLTLSNINGNTSYVKNIYVESKRSSLNIALNKPSIASSVEVTGVEANKANDGNASTRWSSTYTDNQWWQVDLQDISTINNVTLTWENSYASQFAISTSLDGLIFTEAAAGNASGPGTMELNFNPVRARYVRLTGIQRGTQWGISFFELSVYGSSTTAVEPTLEVPSSFQLKQNYPNPFNPSTVIGYQLSTTAEVQLIVYDVLGKEIVTLVNQVQQAGHYTVTFHANNLASGLYYAKLQAEGKVQIRKMMLTK